MNLHLRAPSSPRVSPEGCPELCMLLAVSPPFPYVAHPLTYSLPFVIRYHKGPGVPGPLLLRWTIPHWTTGNLLPSFLASPSHLSPSSICCILFLNGIYFLSLLPECEGQEGSTSCLFHSVILSQNLACSEYSINIC